MISSVTMASFFHRRSVHDKSTVLVVCVGVTALEPPIHRSLVADTNIGLGPPTSHPRPLKWWDLLFGDLLDFKYFGNPSGRQCFLAEVYLLSSLPFIVFFSFDPIF